jgi:hypothetical protein
MYRLYHLVYFVFLTMWMSCYAPTQQSDSKIIINSNWKKIPDSRIQQARQNKHNIADTILLKQFANLIKPDTISNSRAEHVDPNNDYIFNCISADLDGNQTDELICIQGWDIYEPYLCVFKQINDSWYMVYKEQVSTFYGSPTIYIANNHSKNKVFYLRRVYDHGSGVYIDGYSFYKIIGGQVYNCLDIVNDAHIDGWGLYINQTVSSKFDFEGNAEDLLNVTYSYNFYPGSIYKSDCPWCSHDDIPLIHGEETVSYVYSGKHHKYDLEIEKYNNSALNLTAAKIACFADFGDDSLFVKAYKRQIDTTIKIGTSLQKKILLKYLSLVNKNKTARTGELEVKSQAGGTTFYGPKK